MADQRVRGMYSLEVRQDSKKTLKDLDVRKNHSWRPFQLAFILLSIPSLADPKHKGQNTTLGCIRRPALVPNRWRKDGSLLGRGRLYDGNTQITGKPGRSRCVQRAVRHHALHFAPVDPPAVPAGIDSDLCAVEVIRRGEEQTWGKEPFTIGLWVGGAVTPNKTEQAEKYVTAKKNGQRAQGASPCQINNCRGADPRFLK